MQHAYTHRALGMHLRISLEHLGSIRPCSPHAKPRNPERRRFTRTLQRLRTHSRPHATCAACVKPKYVSIYACVKPKYVSIYACVKPKYVTHVARHMHVCGGTGIETLGEEEFVKVERSVLDQV
jgi:hypothetical protein